MAAKDIKELLARKLAENNQRHAEATQETELDIGRQYQKIAITDIVPNPYQPRQTFNDADIAELASSINELGLLQPISVRKKDSKYQLIAGERRLKAYQSLGRTHIESLVISMEDADMALLGLAENLQRQDLSDFEIAQALRHIETVFSSKTKLAEAVGINREDMYRYYAFEAFPESFLNLLSKKPQLIGRSAAADIKRFLSMVTDDDMAIVEQGLVSAWTLLLSEQLTQNKIVDYLKNQLSAPKSQAIENKTKIKQGRRVVGSWQQTTNDVVIKLKAKYLSDEQKLQLQDFLTTMFKQE
ncbi:MAG TPA: ParB/RepB/Spo0J family partition protein [Agitococcus sp.]|nr:ParB/RepB/Spo0J family partition protein [Agitococcus sp.]